MQNDPVNNHALAILHAVRRLRKSGAWYCRYIAKAIVTYSRLKDATPIDELDLGWGDA